MMLQTKNLTKTYGKKENLFYALKDINIEIEKGSITAIVGKSGSGKSTLLHLLIGLDHPEGGGVYYNGKNVLKDLNTNRWRSENVGIIFQQFFLLCKTVRCYALKRFSDIKYDSPVLNIKLLICSDTQVKRQSFYHFIRKTSRNNIQSGCFFDIINYFHFIFR